MAIPKDITEKEILLAIEEIEDNKSKNIPIPKKRYSKDYYLKIEDRIYPPKYVVSIANKHVIEPNGQARGKGLDSEFFEGGMKETNRFLMNLGFEILKRLE